MYLETVNNNIVGSLGLTSWDCLCIIVSFLFSIVHARLAGPTCRNLFMAYCLSAGNPVKVFPFHTMTLYV